MQKIKLSKEDCANAKACILMAIKRPEVQENEMVALLMLAQKFNFEEEKEKK